MSASSPLTIYKSEAAKAAADLVESGMVVGLGTGSTAAMMVQHLARRIREDGLRIKGGVPTSEATATLARSLSIELLDWSDFLPKQIDITIDGADEIEIESLDLVKGLGAAMLREKIVAAASQRLVIIADHSKIVTRLGDRSPLPIEVIPFGWMATAIMIERQFGFSTTMRLDSSGQPLLTDSGNFILDGVNWSQSARGLSNRELAALLNQIPGIVETGLFIGQCQIALVASANGVERFEK